MDTGSTNQVEDICRQQSCQNTRRNNCWHFKANKKTTTLTTQELDQALNCCVKMVQQISYAQEIKQLMEQQEVTSTSSLKTLSNW
jgi:NAD dependent epimerase/dehydratase family enzyme